MPGTVLDAGGTVVPVLMEVAVWWRTEASKDQLKESEKCQGSVV